MMKFRSAKSVRTENQKMEAKVIQKAKFSEARRNARGQQGTIGGSRNWNLCFDTPCSPTRGAADSTAPSIPPGRMWCKSKRKQTYDKIEPKSIDNVFKIDEHLLPRRYKCVQHQPSSVHRAVSSTSGRGFRKSWSQGVNWHWAYCPFGDHLIVFF